MKRNHGFGWDNEFDAFEVAVPAFSIDVYKVTNAEYLEFVRDGGYEQRPLWKDKAWEWITRDGIRHPGFWMPHNGGFVCRTMSGDIGFQPSWPVYVSHAEAEAYARWRGRALPTEAQFHRAAFGTPDGRERQYPWGSERPQARHGNFDFGGWDPTRVDRHPAGNSAFGIAGLVGNGWEWTSTPFAPFKGFKAFDFYPGYSAEFFDGNHYVMKGGSARTAAVLLRRSFRNFFQPLYPNTFSGFRCVDL
jgi:formylglycine-generating enzyme required for sulfatase activity